MVIFVCTSIKVHLIENSKNARKKKIPSCQNYEIVYKVRNQKGMHDVPNQATQFRLAEKYPILAEQKSRPLFVW